MSDASRAVAAAATAGGLALAILCAQQFNMSYDTVGMNVALSTIVEDLNTTLTGMQTDIAMYAVVMAAFMVTGAKLADRWGRRCTFMIGTLVYGVGSGITALSPSLGVLTFGFFASYLTWRIPFATEGVAGIYTEARNTGMQAAAAGVVPLLAFLLAFRPKKPAPAEGDNPVPGGAAV